LEPSHDQLLKFLPILAAIITAAKVAGWASLRLGQPAVFGEILCGLALGPSLLNVLGWPLFANAELGGVLAHLANIGVLFLMFVAGLETDLSVMRRVGTVAALAGIGGVIVPLVLGVGAALPAGHSVAQSVFIGLVLTATSVSITVQTLIELGQLESLEGVTLLAAAVIDDVLAIIALSAFVAIAGASSGSGLGLIMVQMVAFFAVAILIGGRIMRPALRWASRLPVSAGFLAFAVVFMLLYAWASEAVGHVAPITGAYLAGVLVTQAGFREDVEHRMREFVYAILVPIFFISIGLQTNVRLLHVGDLPLAAVIVAVAVFGKILGCGAGALLGGFTRAQAYRVGVGMVSRGEVGLIIATIGMQSGLLTQRLFAVMVIMVVVTTILTPLLLRRAFPQPQLTEAEAVEAIMGDDSPPQQRHGDEGIRDR
jgi:Kef-type K+ transport system membrane component KefB